MDSEKEFKILARKKWVVISGRENSKMGPNMSISWDTAVFSIFSHMLMWMLLGRDLADTAKVLSQSVHLQMGRHLQWAKRRLNFWKCQVLAT